MILTLKNFLSPEDCDHIVEQLNTLEWKGNKNESPEYNEKVKKHLQLNDEDDPLAKKYSNALTDAISNNSHIARFTQLNAIKPVQFNCYKEGGEYGRHSDNARMGSIPRSLRTDYTIGLFLTDDYEGGDLILEHTPDLHETVNREKGTLICYNCGVMHRVTPVTKGERIVAIGWIESQFLNEEERRIVSETEALYEELKAEKGLDHPHTQQISSLYHNLCRRWKSF
jgi:PKHD-type hydroxylase